MADHKNPNEHRAGRNSKEDSTTIRAINRERRSSRQNLRISLAELTVPRNSEIQTANALPSPSCPNGEVYSVASMVNILEVMPIQMQSGCTARVGR